MNTSKELLRNDDYYIRKGFLIWKLKSFIPFILILIFLFITLTIASIESQINWLLYLSYLGVLLLFFCISFMGLLRKWSIQQDLRAIERQCIELSTKVGKNPPTQNLVFSLNRLRQNLQWYAKGTRRDIFPLGDYFSSQLKREIDISFSCISEVLYSTYWESVKGLQSKLDIEEETKRRTFSYSTLQKWSGDLGDHLAGGRRFRDSSPTELSTLKYFFRQWNDLFKNNHEETFETYKQSVNEFYDRAEETSRSRREALIGFALSASLLVVGGIVGYFLAK